MAQHQRLEPDALDDLFGALTARGYEIVGPTKREGAIAYQRLAAPDDLPVGWTDRQEAGCYRLEARGDGAFFGYVVGPQSWKRYLHPPRLSLWRARRTEHGFATTPGEPEAPRYAFVGVRACELQAIAVQDRVFLGGEHRDPSYHARRATAFIVAVNCTQAGGSCFCTSMGSGPAVREGFDLALTEVLADGQHYFVAEAGSEEAAALLAELPRRDASAEELAAATARVADAARQMGRELDTSDVHELLQGAYEHPRWDEVADRCLACGNCTMVCPTCFCTTVEDVTDLTGTDAERVRRWDSCFNADFSYLNGGSVRTSTRSRYRQWMTHKLATWIDQFGTSGCVGCGRCITWCPVGIDITEEVAAIRATSAEAAG